MRELDSTYFNQIYEIMEESFPKAERRTYEEQKALFLRSDYHIFGNIKEGIVVSFLAYYETANFYFLEHIATRALQRGNGAGKELLMQFFSHCKKAVIFEVEPPLTSIAKRRIQFYQRMGAHLYSHVAYTQPSFYEGEEGVPLLLMSWPHKVSQETLKIYIEAIYQEIYKIR